MFSSAGCNKLDSVHWGRGWVKEGNHYGEADEPYTLTQNLKQLHQLTQPCPACPPDSPPPISKPSFGQILITAAPNIPLWSQHGYALPVEAVIAEAGLLPGQLWLHLGHDAAAFHHPAASQPWEQRCTEATDPGPQQALHQGPGWGKPKCHGWALCGYHDSLRWVVCSCNGFQTARWEWCETKTLHEMERDSSMNVV